MHKACAGMDILSPLMVYYEPLMDSVGQQSLIGWFVGRIMDP